MASQVIRKNDFQRLLLNAINPAKINKINKLGIAVNHKPESLVLVGMLSDCLPKEHLHAFSIDFKMNAQYSRQILQISEQVSNIGVEIQSLKYDYKMLQSKADQSKPLPLHGKILKKRMNAMLVQECRNNNISILAFGDTLEDYLVSLLKGIFSQKAGYVHGLDVLGSLCVSGDRVMALRPLLKYNMKQILATYEVFSGIGIGSRATNPVKQMIVEAFDSDTLRIGDTFLTVPSLLDLGFHMFDHRMEVWKRVSGIFKRDIRCDEALGLYFIKIDISREDITYHWMHDIEITHTIFRILLAMINGLDPIDAKYSIEILERFRKTVLNTSFKKNPTAMAKGLLNPPRASNTGRGVWIFGREPFTKNEIEELTYSFKSGDSVLWDNRFKISVSCNDPQKTFLIRPFTINDFSSFEKYLQSMGLSIDAAYEFKQKLNLLKTRTPILLRQNLPCIELDGKIISIPSLNIHFNNQIKVDFKYCGYRSAFGKVVGLTQELFEDPDSTEPDSEESHYESYDSFIQE